MKSNGDDSVVDTIFPNFATFHKDRAIRKKYEYNRALHDSSCIVPD